MNGLIGAFAVAMGAFFVGVGTSNDYDVVQVSAGCFMLGFGGVLAGRWLLGR